MFLLTFSNEMRTKLSLSLSDTSDFDISSQGKFSDFEHEVDVVLLSGISGK